MTVTNHIGETVRGYQVLVAKKKNISLSSCRQTILYPTTTDRAALKLMERLKNRGFDCAAVTKSFGEVEYLDIDELKLMVL